MPTSQERTPQEKETLVFPDSEKAREFVGRVEKRINREKQPGVDNRRELVARELAEEFEASAEGVDIVRHPWEHNQEEHKEARELMDLAFSKDLFVALRRAKSSSNYPRNLDLFHDILTGEVYKLIIENKVNKQPLAYGVLITSVVLAFSGLLLMAAFLLVFLL